LLPEQQRYLSFITKLLANGNDFMKILRIRIGFSQKIGSLFPKPIFEAALTGA